jgi:hypothetical protein
MKRNRFNDIVKRALVRTVTNVGQLTAEQKLDLEYAVRKGWLIKGKGGPYPILKSVYARPGFDFRKDREASVAELRRMHMVDLARGTARFFPFVQFQGAKV